MFATRRLVVVVDVAVATSEQPLIDFGPTVKQREGERGKSEIEYEIFSKNHFDSCRLHLNNCRCHSQSSATPQEQLQPNAFL